MYSECIAQSMNAKMIIIIISITLIFRDTIKIQKSLSRVSLSVILYIPVQDWT